MHWILLFMVLVCAAPPATAQSRDAPDDEQIEALLLERARAYLKANESERRAARRGHIFTPVVAEHVNALIRRAFRGSDGRNMRRSIREAEVVTLPTLRVNDVYPADLPLTMMPPTLLRRLPELPMELAYRISGRALMLQNVKTAEIVDFILYAIPVAR